MCDSNGDFVDHILLHLFIARDLWGILLCLSDVSWTMPRLVNAMLASWNRKLGKLNNGEVN